MKMTELMFIILILVSVLSEQHNASSDSSDLSIKQSTKATSVYSSTSTPTNNPTVSPITNVIISSISIISTSSETVTVNGSQRIHGLDKLHLLLIIVIVLMSTIICMVLIFCLAYFYKNGQNNTKNSIVRKKTDSANQYNIKQLNLEMVNSNSHGVPVNDIMDKMNKSIPVNMSQPNIGSLPSVPQIQQPGSAEIVKLDISRNSSLSETYNNDDYKMEVSKEGSANVQPGSYPPEIGKLDDMVSINYKNYKNYNVNNNDDANSDHSHHSYHSHLNVDVLPEQTSTPNDTNYCTETGDV